MSELRIGSLCSGYEGLGAGVMQVLGGRLAFVADNDPGASAILAHRFPGVPNLGDIMAADWAAAGPVDVLTAGFPCQDVSQAGKRAGLQRGNRSGIWFSIVQAIEALRPGLVIIENTRGLLTARGDLPTQAHLRAEAARDTASRLLEWLENEADIACARGDRDRARRVAARTARVMGYRKRAVARCQWHERRLVRAVGTVLGSLADLSYDAVGTVVSAADAGAPHRRERVFIVAWPAADADSGKPGPLPGGGRVSAGPGTATGGELRLGPGLALGDSRRTAADAGGGELQRRGIPGVLGEPAQCGAATPHPDGATRGERRVTASGEAEGGGARADAGRRGGTPAPDADGADAGSHSGGGGAETSSGTGSGPERRGEPGPGISCGAPANPGCDSWPQDDPDEPAAARRGGDPAADPDELGREIIGRVQPGLGSWGDADGCGPGDSGPTAWGPYGPAITRWEAVTGRAAPPPTEPGRTGARLSPRFVEWLMGLPDGWVTGVPGLSRNDQLKALGNGCVPQQVALALRLLLADALGRAA